MPIQKQAAPRSAGSNGLPERINRGLRAPIPVAGRRDPIRRTVLQAFEYVILRHTHITAGSVTPPFATGFRDILPAMLAYSFGAVTGNLSSP